MTAKIVFSSEHPLFLSRPNPIHKRLSAKRLQQLARQLAAAGQYNTATLALFRWRWQLKTVGWNWAPAWIEYLLFRRALGYPLTAQRAVQAQRLLCSNVLDRINQGLYGYHKQKLRDLLNEYQWLIGQPAVANQPLLAFWRRQQSLWQQQLCGELAGYMSLALVGNASQLQQQSAGETIDQADCVVRFNQAFAVPAMPQSTGKKTSIWVVAPDFRGPAVAADWLILSGPAMLWSINNIQYLRRLKPKRLLMVPLSHWRQLVRKFAAPPSAGVLAAAMLRQCSPVQLRFQYFGVGYQAYSGSDYHQALPLHRAVNRHHWQAEWQWWQEQAALPEYSDE